MSDFDDKTRAALVKTERLLGALEALRGKCGILESQMGVVWEVFKHCMGSELPGELAQVLPMLQGLIGGGGNTPVVGPPLTPQEMAEQLSLLTPAPAQVPDGGSPQVSAGWPFPPSMFVPASEG